MQVWFLGIVTLNLIFGIKLLRVWGISENLCGPIAFVALTGVPRVRMSGTNAQLLPIFPAL